MVRDGHAERVADARRRHGRRRSASRGTSSSSSRRPRCCTTSARSVSTNPTTAARPSRSRSRTRAPTILRGTQLLAPAGDIIAAEWMPYRENGRLAAVGDVGPDPQGRERVRRAVRRASRARRPRTRSALLGAGVPLRRARARARSRWCSTGAVCSRSALLSFRPRRAHAASPGYAAALEAQVDDPERDHDVADRELLVGEPGSVMTSPRNCEHGRRLPAGGA